MPDAILRDIDVVHVITTLQGAFFANPISQSFPIRSSVETASGLDYQPQRTSQHAVYPSRQSSRSRLAHDVV